MLLETEPLDIELFDVEYCRDLEMWLEVTQGH